MKEYIVLTYRDNSLVFDYKNINDEEKEYINKNILYKDSLFYTLRYFRNNINKIIKLFSDSKYKINWLIVMRIVTFKYVSNIMNNLNIKKLRLLFNSTLSLDDYDIILKIKNIEEIDCYFMPNFILDKCEKQNIKVSIHNTNKITDKFMLNQDALDYDVLYYKKSIVIKEEYSLLLSDIKEFLRINYNIKGIDIYVYSKEIIEGIIELVKQDESKNVIILLHQSSDKENFIINNFSWLKRLNEECKQELTCEFRIIYSNNFVKNNLFKQLSFNNLKLVIILIIYVLASAFLIYKSYFYVEKLNSQKVKTDILNEEANRLDINDNLGGIDEEGEEEAPTQRPVDNVLGTLVATNSETVGYLVVNNTEISYPVVKHSDNNYYLRNDFYKNYSSSGWVFLDYRNSGDKLDYNNIIYAHSMKNGTMFGTLKNVLSYSWRNDSNNMVISYDTTYGSFKFKIFSIYKVDYTTDYLKTDFDGERDFDDFVKLIKGRSIFNSDEEVNYGDTVLTLSTCTGTSNQRLVVHSVLMKVGE